MSSHLSASRPGLSVDLFTAINWITSRPSDRQFSIAARLVDIDQGPDMGPCSPWSLNHWNPPLSPHTFIYSLHSHISVRPLACLWSYCCYRCSIFTHTLHCVNLISWCYLGFRLWRGVARYQRMERLEIITCLMLIWFWGSLQSPSSAIETVCVAAFYGCNSCKYDPYAS